MKRITFTREYDVTMVEKYTADVPDDVLAEADADRYGPGAGTLDQYVTDNFSPDYEDRLEVLENSLTVTWSRHPVERGEEPVIEVKCYCPECKLLTIVPVPYRTYVAWMNRTPLEELIDDEDTIEVLTTGRCEMHRATKGEQG